MSPNLCTSYDLNTESGKKIVPAVKGYYEGHDTLKTYRFNSLLFIYSIYICSSSQTLSQVLGYKAKKNALPALRSLHPGWGEGERNSSIAGTR